MIVDIDKENNKVTITDNYDKSITLTYEESVGMLETIIKNIMKEVI
jgi:hypothetical protein